MSGVTPSYDYSSVQTIKRNVAPGSLLVTWTTGGSSYTLTDDGAGGLTGDGSGEVSYATGLIFINPSPAPAPSDGDYTIQFEDWQGNTKLSDTITLDTVPANSTTYNPATAMRAGSVKISTTVRVITKETSKDSVKTFEHKTKSAVITDDGAGGLVRQKGGPPVGTVNYATGAIEFDIRSSYSYQTRTKLYDTTQISNGIGGTTSYTYGYWKSGTGTAIEEYDVSSAVIEWTDPGDPVQVKSTTRPIPGMTIDLTPGNSRSVIPNSVIFEVGGGQYRDQDGALIKNWSPITGAGEVVGTIDYFAGLATLTSYPAGMPTSTPVNLIACLTTLDQAPTEQTIFRTAGAPLREGSLIINAVDIDGASVSGISQTDGSIIGAGIDPVDSLVDTQTGLVKISWTNAVLPSSVRYSAVSYTFLPLDSELVGLDATRLPSDGRVPQFNRGDVVVVSNTKQQEVATATANQVITFTRQNQAEVWVEGANGNRLDPAQYTLDTTAGTLTMSSTLALVDVDANAVTEPLQVFDRVEDMGLATDVQIGGQISLNIPLSQDYTAGETIASAALLYGDLRARAHNVFHQKSWNGAWSDALVGDSTTAKYNLVAHPVEITNQGSIKERWAIRFTSSSSFDVIGETVGVVASGNTTVDLAPTNQATGAPYFTIRKEGWGSGWVAGNTLRLNTEGGQAPFWVARTVVAGRATEEQDQFSTQNRGDAD